MFRIIKKQSPARIIALGFALLILIGSILLSLPCSIQEGQQISYINALYTSTSAVCVTGLIAVPAGVVFTPLGQFFLAMLIQAGGLGVTVVGATVILAVGGRVNIKGRKIIREALNAESGKGLVTLIKKVLLVTLIFETIGVILSFLVFAESYPTLKALGLSLFHSVAAFNNSGFDIFEGNLNLQPYAGDVLLNLTTCMLIFFGGIGFWVICDIWRNKLCLKKLSMHSKVCLSVSAALIIVGAILLKLTENVTWLGAIFQSVSARTAGFATYDLGKFTKSGLLVLIVLMFIGASPGSTGGGIKTTTFFVLMKGIWSSSTNEEEKAFHYALPKEGFRKASVITFLALGVVIVGTFLMGIFEPEIKFIDALFEVTSAFGTVGLSTGITGDLSVKSKLLSIIIMYIGRLGPLTIATLWHFSKGERVRYPEGNISIG